jgi:hypothetical protein
MATQAELRKQKAKILDTLTALSNLLGESRYTATDHQQVADFFGVPLATVQEWGKTKGVGGAMPGERGCYPLDKIAQWLRQVGPWCEASQGGDPLLTAGASPALERYRTAKAALAELELAKRRREHELEMGRRNAEDNPDPDEAPPAPRVIRYRFDRFDQRKA